jgi:hypothetical protein
MSPAPRLSGRSRPCGSVKSTSAEHPGTDFLVGSGDSMLPLYKDHTVVITQKDRGSDLRAGMTAVYIGDQGRPVAHVLVKKTRTDGSRWGSATPSATTPVTEENLIGSRCEGLRALGAARWWP